MDGTKIVTGLVILSLTTAVGCKAKFTSKNKPASGQPATSATGGNPSGPASKYPNGPNPQPGSPVVSQPTGPLVGPGPQQPTGPVVTPRPTQPPSCLTGDDTSLEKGKPVQQQTIIFKRGRQMVWRKDCDGHVVSKKYEVMTGNTMRSITIRPVGGTGAMTVFNRSTCHATTTQNSLQSDATGVYKFTVSTQKSNHAMVVKPGNNYIDYTIGTEHGTLILTVKIDETEGDCVVISARGCEPRRESTWSDSAFNQ